MLASISSILTRRAILTSIATAATFSAAALGQDTAVANVETETEAATPVDQPGHDVAPRARGETPAPAAPAAPARDWFGHRSWFDWSRATGDWGGARTALEDGGLTIAGSFTHDWSYVIDGGVHNRGSSRRLFDINATLDMDKAFGWKGGTVFADFYHYGGRIVNDAGDSTGYLNFATDRHRDQLAEVWFQQTFFEGGVRVKLGKIEAAKEFGVLSSTSSFLHTAGAYSSNMLPAFPTYPDPALGAVVFAYPCENFYAGFGFFDGATLDGIRTGSRAGFDTLLDDDKSDDNYIIGELGFTWKNFGKVGGRFGKGRLAGGVWHHTHEFAGFDGNPVDGTTGGYIMGEQHVWKSNDDDASDKGLWLFGRAGFADDNAISIGTHVGAGVTLRGTFEGRENDEVGFMWNYADMSDKTTAFDGNEHAFEVFYRLQLFGSVVVTPDFQYISNPSGNNTIDDAVTANVRVQVTF